MNNLEWPSSLCLLVLPIFLLVQVIVLFIMAVKWNDSSGFFCFVSTNKHYEFIFLRFLELSRIFCLFSIHETQPFFFVDFFWSFNINQFIICISQSIHLGIAHDQSKYCFVCSLLIFLSFKNYWILNNIRISFWTLFLTSSFYFLSLHIERASSSLLWIWFYS